jgi:predicted permease
MLNDVRLAARQLLQARSWSAVVVLCLALGIGANTALFSAINGLLLRQLAVSDPDSLVRFRHAGQNDMRTDVLVYGFAAPDARGRPVEATFSYPMYRQLVESNGTLSDLFACAPFGPVNVVVGGQAQTASAFLSSGNYFRALGATARIGRILEPDDDRPTAPPVAVISHQYWMSRFGGSPTVVGAVARVNNAPVTIVGVLSPGFTGVERAVGEAPDVSLPIALEPRVTLPRSSLQSSLLAAPNFWWLHVMGRLKPGVSVEQAQANFAGVFQEAARTGFDAWVSSLPAEERSRSYLQQTRSTVPELIVDSGSRGIYDVAASDRRAVTMLTAVVVLVLLIVCANVANLLLSRSTARQRELAVRLALGATRARLVRQLLTESVLLAAIGGALGLLVARWGQPLLPIAAAAALPFDWRVLAFVVTVTTATGVAFGIAPALRSTRTDVSAALKDESRGIVRSRGLLAKALVVAQVTISLVLLVGAGLFLRTLQNLRQVDIGFNPRNVLLFRVSPALNRYDASRQGALYEQIGERVRAMSARRFSGGMYVQGRAYARGQNESISGVVVSPAFFETMEIPLVAGRGFTTRDAADAPRVAVINEAAARKFFPNEPAIGRRFGTTREQSGELEVVGVLRDAKYNNVRDAAVPTMYRSYLQSPQGTATFEVRTAGDPLTIVAGVRDAVRQIDPNLPIVNVTTQLDEVEARFAQERTFAQAYTLFGGLALLVASVGLFGVMSYSVARRTMEIGIRMALGAERRDVLGLVMRESMGLVAAGAALGLAGALAASRLVSTLLFGLAPTDPVTFAGALTVMVVVAAVAGYLPARRASRVDPMVALRCE